MISQSALTSLAAAMRRRAFRYSFDGRMENLWVIRACTFDDHAHGLRIIFTRDVGHHTSGWFKNPDYERCLHLSVSPLALAPGAPSDTREPPRHIDSALLHAFFGDAVRYAWFESPKTPEGRRSEVRHWRVFCDQAWQPLLPRGEVYSRELTERGWKSASELGVVIESPLTP